jgi:predicted Zn-dependent protease
MELGDLADASDNLLKLVRQHPDFTPAYYFLGQSLGQQQQLGDAHYYLGVFYLRKRDFKNAKIQLKQALKHPQSDERQKKINDWLGTMNGKDKEQAKNGG